ncbi:hypothetical protein HDC34_003216 [Pseudoclavibacter sp. JAI123]|nr:hypothetical protein [Pseudoclavibacter sp. JAI123]
MTRRKRPPEIRAQDPTRRIIQSGNTKAGRAGVGFAKWLKAVTSIAARLTLDVILDSPGTELDLDSLMWIDPDD